jgi:hypothetical protein
MKGVKMWDFLTFQSFITPKVLTLFYYIGAVLMPLLGWSMMRWLKHRYFPDFIPPKRFYLYLIALLCFLCMELFWRMMFEFLIAYFDMHDALMRMSR